MTFDPTEFNWWLGASFAWLLLVVWGQRKKGTASGLVLIYLVQLWANHWFGAAIHILPGYWPPDAETQLGLQVSTYAFAGFAIGSTFIVPLALRRRPRILGTPLATSADKWLVHRYLLIGVLAFFVFEPALHSIPTVGAIALGMTNLLVAGLCMECWNALASGHTSELRFWQWLLVATLLPLITVVTRGYLGYGLGAMLVVFAFVASFYKARWKMVLVGTLASYLALSMFVTYMRDRRAIRASVWGQESYSLRFDRISEMLADFEFIDFNNPAHLDRISERLDQDSMLGAAVLHLEREPQLFAHGRTIWEALLTPIPRALWPDKPTAAGSGELVTEFTGIKFMGDTSVGIGHIMEWYVNFDLYGVFFGMLGIGTVLGWLDRRAAETLFAGNWGDFVIWWLPGLGMIQVGGSLVDTVSMTFTALATALIVRRFQPGTSRRAGIQPRLAADGRYYVQETPRM